MKKIAAIILLMLLGNRFNAKAQNLYFGVNGGYLKNSKIIQSFSVTPQYAQDVTSKTLLNNYTCGLNLGYRFSDHWHIETQVQFTNEGYKERLDLLQDFHSGAIAGSKLAELDWYHNWYYVRVPLLAYYNFFPSKSSIGIGLFAGPNLGFLTNQISKYVGINELGVEMANTLDLEDKPLKKVDIGFQFGIRVQSKLNKTISVFMDGSMYQGFNNILIVPPFSYQDENIVNRHFTANIGLQINLPATRTLLGIK
ncbi:hypothetical protein DBR32_08910 [Taibaiella sp. KBW10]|uniref:outer membrane beta-barrel protein n=1 Tax=Taibaiella sp. KBW10 TaxID=2153357 RepID=UPI000F5B2DD3|nr:outer membrane beta-barrel protein [Taibaiella sp. KBW10]RQO30828.1 hypothetical protein DBR32_08910 [Taibaiella sp. KBW10]